MQSVLVAPPGVQGRVPVVPVPVEEPLVPVPVEEPLVLLDEPLVVPLPSLLDPVPASERRIAPLERESESLPDMWAQPDSASPSAAASAIQLSFFIVVSLREIDEFKSGVAIAMPGGRVISDEFR